MNSENVRGICDHCGSVAKALTIWTKEQIEGCVCLCHIAKQQRDYEASLPKKRKRKK